MMADYIPDSWSILEVDETDQPLKHKVMAGFDGSYLYGSSWQLNSGITKIDEQDASYIVHGVSGSTYLLHKGCEGVRGYAAIIAADLLKQAEAHDTVSLKVVEMKDIFSKYQNKYQEHEKPWVKTYSGGKPNYTEVK